ncbi:hypothetical protein [Pseudothermotoga thermarum]|nr:hypothetical protein [Pseudothermotoga thermarum]
MLKKVFLTSLTLFMLFSVVLLAEQYPSGPVTVIVPYAQVE